MIGGLPHRGRGRSRESVHRFSMAPPPLSSGDRVGQTGEIYFFSRRLLIIRRLRITWHTVEGRGRRIGARETGVCAEHEVLAFTFLVRACADLSSLLAQLAQFAKLP